MKNIHIIFNSNQYPALRSAISSEEECVCLIDDLSVGKLHPMDFTTRFQSLKRMEYPADPDILKKNEELTEIICENDDPIYLWVTDSPGELLYAAYICFKCRENRQVILNRIVGQVGNEPPGYERYRYDDKTMCDIWKQAVQENTELRILQNNRIVSVKASFFDQLIQHQIRPHLSRKEIAINSVLQIQKKYGYIISIYFVFYRLRIINEEDI